MQLSAEWMPHKATWLAWPDLPNEWGEFQEGARQEFLALSRAIASEGSRPREVLKIFVKNDEQRRRVELELKGIPTSFFYFDYGDIWVRDTGCLFGKSSEGLEGHCFRFNGWGEKYIIARDPDLSMEMAAKAGAKPVRHAFVFEGGAVDHNGAGLWVTTEQCLLNRNRNSDMTKSDYQNHFSKLGARDICWIPDGLLNDHTDGHVDNILRFVNEKTLICMESAGDLDPHAEVLGAVLDFSNSWASKHGLTLEKIKSPGEVRTLEGDYMPASYMNFYIANNSVIVPQYGTRNDAQAVEKIAKLFPDRKTVGLASNNLLTGGGSFHCITQQEP